MASILRVNTLTDASSNNSIATSFVAGGSAKAWVNFDGTGTPAFRDSLNAASITDNGTGDQTVNFTNNMNNDDFSRVTAVGENANTGGNRVSGLRLPSTSSYRIITMNTSATDVDCQDNCSTVHGDLA